jgi:hypothetical protein
MARGWHVAPCRVNEKTWCLSKMLLEQEFYLERMTGIEPALSAWEAEVLPLNYIRASSRKSALEPRHPINAAAAGGNRRSRGSVRAGEFCRVQLAAWMRMRLPAGSRTAKSRTPQSWSIGSCTTSALAASTRSNVPSRSSVARRTPE